MNAKMTHVSTAAIALVAVLAAPVAAAPQSASEAPVLATPAPVAAAAPTAATRTIVLPHDTPIEMMVMAEVSTKEHGEGHRFKLRTTKAVTIDGQPLIPANALAWGEVTSAEKSGTVGKGGKLSARLLYLEHDGRRIRLEGETTSKSRNQTGAVVAAVVGVGLLGLLARGNNAKLKAGELMTGFVAEDTAFDVSAEAASPVSAPAVVPAT